MAARARRTTPVGRKPPSKPSAASTRPYLRFYHSPELRRKTLALLGKIEKARDAAAHRAALADLIVELTGVGLDTYFLKSLRLARAGFVMEQSANLGMKAAQQVMAPAIRQIIGRMDGAQLLSVCGSIRKFMR